MFKRTPPKEEKYIPYAEIAKKIASFLHCTSHSFNRPIDGTFIGPDPENVYFEFYLNPYDITNPEELSRVKFYPLLFNVECFSFKGNTIIETPKRILLGLEGALARNLREG